jgi:hypothetical protein
MTSAPINSFTAAEIASALGRKRANVARLLADVPAAGVKIVSGNEARAWTVSELPAPMQLALSAGDSPGGLSPLDG